MLAQASTTPRTVRSFFFLCGPSLPRAEINQGHLAVLDRSDDSSVADSSCMPGEQDDVALGRPKTS
jgi:hypothetical protein